MNIKKILFIISILIVNLIIANISFASYDTPIYLGVTELKTETVPNIGYAIETPNSSKKLEKIWNIVKYTQEDSNDPTEANFYSAKTGIGFSNTHKIASYDKKFNLKTEKDKIKEQNQILANLVNSKQYNNLLALIDIIYIPEEPNQEEKDKFLEKANINKNDWDVELTNDDIEAIQQAAIWYFTNYDNEAELNKYESSKWLYYTSNGNIYKNLSEYAANGEQDEGEQRQKQAEILYKYLIDTANSNAINYENEIKIEEPITINTKILNSQTTQDYYILGPLNIKQNNNLTYSINITIKNQDEIDISNKMKLLDSNKNETEKKIEELVGKNFYIKIPKEQTKTINLEINATYKITNAIIYASSTNNQEQPVIFIENENKPISVQLSVTPEQKSFDLALRQYITKINQTQLVNTRVPNVNIETLKSETTASYKHRKDPVVVEKGDIVTYKLTIYNEGQKEGRASKIINQLPEGLKFSKVVSGDFTKVNYDEENNRVELIKSSNNNLKGYNVNNTKLESETIEIECEVIANEDEEKEKLLTNIAWISEEIDAEDNKIITNQTNQDRDSEPQTCLNAKKNNMTNYKGVRNKEDLTDSEYYYKGQQDDDDFEKLIIIPKRFDLKLINRVVEVNGEPIEERIKKVDASKINTLNQEGKTITTGDYTVNKNPVSVKKGDIIKYTFRIYNEGNADGYASEIKESIPEGLEFLYTEDLANSTSLSEIEKKAIEYNNSMLWQISNTDENMKISEVSTQYLSKESEIESNANLIKAFGTNDGTKTENNISYKEVSIMLKVISDDVTGTVIQNEACISKNSDKNGQDIKDRDSDPQQWIKYEDDEDYDSVKLQSYDLALREFVIAVSKNEDISEADYLKNANGSYKRAPQVDTSKLNTEDENKKMITTATYNQTKTPVSVMKEDIVVYMLRVYNEGEIDAYASEVTVHLPQYLEFIDNKFNKKYNWQILEDGKTVKSNYLTNSKIPKAVKNEQETMVLSYKDVPIMCKVSSKAKTDEVITNIAEITDYKDENKKDINDRDSQKSNIELPKQSDLPNYKDNENGTYIKGNQDDDDFEKVVIKKFDLAIKTFITQINNNEISNRTNITNKSQNPISVLTNDTVTYTIRLYNEGKVNGYASKVTSDIPKGLEFIQDDDINKTYKWKMIDTEDKETNNINNAVKITTDYASKEQGDTRAKESNKFNRNDAILKAADSNNEIIQPNSNYIDLKLNFKVTNTDAENNIVITSSQIVETQDENGNKIEDDNKENNNEDKEYAKIIYFHLNVKNSLAQTIFVENGKENITNIEDQSDSNNKKAEKVELDSNKLENTTVKFKYSIRVTNEGDIPGYATEITDYIPEGLKFVKEDNTGWEEKENNTIITTTLKNKLLQPGEYKDIDLTLTWINGKENIGLKTNTVEISEYKNNQNVKDTSSNSNNTNQTENTNESQVLITLSTNRIKIYIIIGFIAIIIVSIVIIIVKKYMLKN